MKTYLKKRLKKIMKNKIKFVFKIIKKVVFISAVGLLFCPPSFAEPIPTYVFEKVAGNVMVYRKVEELLKIKQVQALNTLLLLLLKFPTS
jgi:hypothetical protein